MSQATVSTHAPLAGSDLVSVYPVRDLGTFQPTLPLRGATRDGQRCNALGEFQPTLPLRGATSARVTSGRERRRFNPRSPCGERRDGSRSSTQRWKFQPTLPLRGATFQASRRSPPPSCFNPRSPCGERPTGSYMFPSLALFQPTLPLRGATLLAYLGAPGSGVSTHAPLAGSDLAVSLKGLDLIGFNPRSPCGERHTYTSTIERLAGFQPTLPLRGATLRIARRVGKGHVSTHAPLAGSDW